MQTFVFFFCFLVFFLAREGKGKGKGYVCCAMVTHDMSLVSHSGRSLNAVIHEAQCMTCILTHLTHLTGVWSDE